VAVDSVKLIVLGVAVLAVEDGQRVADPRTAKRVYRHAGKRYGDRVFVWSRSVQAGPLSRLKYRRRTLLNCFLIPRVVIPRSQRQVWRRRIEALLDKDAHPLTPVLTLKFFAVRGRLLPSVSRNLGQYDRFLSDRYLMPCIFAIAGLDNPSRTPDLYWILARKRVFLCLDV
jgi:hypothetical protein